MPRNAEVAWNATYSVKAKKMRSTIFSEGTSRMCNFVTKDKLSNGTPQVSGGHLGGPDCAFYVYLNCVFMLTWGQSGPGLQPLFSEAVTNNYSPRLFRIHRRQGLGREDTGYEDAGEDHYEQKVGSDVHRSVTNQTSSEGKCSMRIRTD
ncbi:MAG: hypothetical protein DMG15_24095 [Acidobacteria bacterium]|nr:MAG: hypothetical protein DMG15_24095 [Acidobacteriota bacterium]